MADEQNKTLLQVYVIMPFSKTTEDHTEDYWTEHFEHFIRDQINEIVKHESILNQYDWRIYRSSVDKGGPLNYEIVWDLFTSQIVIADITDKNANVLYELGIRHALTAALGNSRTIIIQDTNVFNPPFDFANYAVITYDKKRKDTWKKAITRRLVECIQSFSYRDNPVSMTFAQHSFSFTQSNTQAENIKNMQAFLDIIERMLNMGFTAEWIQSFINPQNQIVQPRAKDTDEDSQ
jgi:hypothetical protein